MNEKILRRKLLADGRSYIKCTYMTIAVVNFVISTPIMCIRKKTSTKWIKSKYAPLKSEHTTNSILITIRIRNRGS